VQRKEKKIDEQNDFTFYLFLEKICLYLVAAIINGKNENIFALLKIVVFLTC
jgi:hypothetical protein